MRWRSVLAATALLAVAAPVPAQTAGDALKLVPKDALGFVVVNRLGETSDKLAALAKQFGAKAPATPLEMVKQHLGVQKGLDDKGSLVVALLPAAEEGGEPVPVAYVPVADGKQFLQELKVKDADADVTEAEVQGQTLAVGRKGSFAVLAKGEHREALKKALGGGAGVADKVAPLQAWLAENNVAGVMTANGAKVTTTLAMGALQGAKLFLPDRDSAEGKVAGAVFEGVEGFLKSAQQSVTGAGIGLRVDGPGNLHLTSRVLVARGSDWAKAGEGIEPIPGAPFAGLPARPFALAFGGPLPEATMKGLTDFSLQMVKAALKDAPEEQVKKLEDAYAEMNKGVRGMSLVVGTPKEGASLFSNTVVAMKVKDAAGYLGRYEKGMKIVGEVLKDTKLPFGTALGIRRVKIDELGALEVVTDLTGGKNDLPQEQKKLVEVMVGPGGKMTATLVPVDESTVLIVYRGSAEAKALVKAFKKDGGTEAPPGVAKVAALLPRGAQWVGYLSPKGAMDLVRQGAAAVGQGQNVPPFPEAPPIGLAVKGSATGKESHLVVPAETIRAIGKLIMDLTPRRPDA